MRFHRSCLEGIVLIDLKQFVDKRGYFTRFWDSEPAVAEGLPQFWAQESISFSQHRGTIRGLHFQHKPLQQAKCIILLQGKITDIALDIRPRSQTCGQWCAFELDAAKPQVLFLPKGFAHGFVTRTDNCMLIYKMDEIYDPQVESGIIWNDGELGIPWQVDSPIISERDQGFGTYAEVMSGIKKQEQT